MHYRINISFSYDVETDEEYNELIKRIDEEFSQKIEDKLILKKVIRAERLTKSKHKIKIAEFPPEEIFEKLRNDPAKTDFVIGQDTYQVRLNSSRYFVLKKNPYCVACGIKGTKMFLEQHPDDKAPHFNLYAIEDGKLVMLTKDHVVPRSRGGDNSLDNYVTLCSICNNIKANYNINLEQLNKLRIIYNENQHLTRKELAELIRLNRSKIVYNF